MFTVGRGRPRSDDGHRRIGQFCQFGATPYPQADGDPCQLVNALAVVELAEGLRPFRISRHDESLTGFASPRYQLLGIEPPGAGRDSRPGIRIQESGPHLLGVELGQCFTQCRVSGLCDRCQAQAGQSFGHHSDPRARSSPRRIASAVWR